MSRLFRKLISTESEWNPKIIVGRVILRMLPNPVIRRLKKHYYAYLLTHMPKDWVERDAAALPQFITIKDYVVDIGANIGVFSRFLAGLVGEDGKVYAFEPIPETSDYLCHNIRKMRLPQIQAMRFALSDANGVNTMVIPHYRWGAECSYDATIKTEQAKAGWREIQVESRTLDSFNLPRVSFIKCDTNGHELATLRGALKTIRKYRPIMLIEITGDPEDQKSTAHKTFLLLNSEGYTAYIYRGRKIMPRQTGERSQNYFFLPKAMLSELA